MDEQGRPVAIVTGGLVGIGRAIAERLTADGMRVAVGARRGGEAAEQQAARAAIGPRTAVHRLDVCEEASVEAFCRAIEQECGTIDVLVNAAGITHHQLVSQHDTKAWRDTIETNLTGPFLMIRACLPGMIARGHGRIVNIASTAARTAVADHAAYCAAKAGLLGLTRAVALEGAPHGVTCISVSPTWVETEMLRSSAAIMARQSGRSPEEEIAEIARANPQNRLVQPPEIAAVVALACSDQAPSLTMEDISVNAGAHW